MDKLYARRLIGYIPVAAMYLRKLDINTTDREIKSKDRIVLETHPKTAFVVVVVVVVVSCTCFIFFYVMRAAQKRSIVLNVICATRAQIFSSRLYAYVSGPNIFS